MQTRTATVARTCLGSKSHRNALSCRKARLPKWTEELGARRTARSASRVSSCFVTPAFSKFCRHRLANSGRTCAKPCMLLELLRSSPSSIQPFAQLNASWAARRRQKMQKQAPQMHMQIPKLGRMIFQKANSASAFGGPASSAKIPATEAMNKKLL